MTRLAAGPRVVWRPVLALALLATGVAGAQQEPEIGRGYAPHGPLVIWLVTSTPGIAPRTTLPRRVATQVQLPTTVQTQTAGSFGQTAGSYGQTAGSTGQTAGSFGQTAGSTGQSAGDAGQTAGSFGRTAGSVGKNAGDAGRTMSEFGVSTTDLARAASLANGGGLSATSVRRDTSLNHLVADLTQTFPDLQLRFEDVEETDLAARLAAGAPDVLLGAPLPRAWTRPDSELSQHYGLHATWHAVWYPMNEYARPGLGVREAAVMAHAQNAKAARAVALWVSDGGVLDASTYGGGDRVRDAIAAVAARVVPSVLTGLGVGSDADADMAQTDSAAELALLTSVREENAAPIKIQTEITSVQVRAGLAVVGVEAIGSADDSFGAAHALLILRKDAGGRWRVLHISPNLPREQQRQGMNVLLSYLNGGGQALGLDGSAALRNEGNRALGVKQVAPVDGDLRAPQPELGWDNLGGATLQVVEWQQKFAGWAAPNLFFVPDNNSRLRTRVTASFATVPGAYRWRVWSLGPEGVAVLSPWRNLTIAPR